VLSNPIPILPHAVAAVGSRVHGRRAEVEEAAEKERREEQKAAKKEQQEARKWAAARASTARVAAGIKHDGLPWQPARLPYLAGGSPHWRIERRRGVDPQERQDPEVNAGGTSLLAGRGGRRPLEAAPGRSSGPVPATAAVISCPRCRSSCG
jgi:hypothetical protein